MRETARYVDLLLLASPPLGTWPATQACALTGNRTGNPLVHRPMLNPLNYTSQGKPNILIQKLNTETFFTPGRYFKRHKSQTKAQVMDVLFYFINFILVIFKLQLTANMILF